LYNLRKKQAKEKQSEIKTQGNLKTRVFSAIAGRIFLINIYLKVDAEVDIYTFDLIDTKRIKIESRKDLSQKLPLSEA
jgi:hypothetical protein